MFVPFLVPYHNYPLLTFYTEWVAFQLGLVTAALALIGRKEDPALLPWIPVNC